MEAMEDGIWNKLSTLMTYTVTLTGLPVICLETKRNKEESRESFFPLRWEKGVFPA